MTEVRLEHTADLDAATLAAARTLMDVVFEGDFDDHDWEHALVLPVAVPLDLAGPLAADWRDGDVW